MKTHAWQRTLGSWLIFPVVYLCIYNANINLLWIILSFLVYLSISITVSVGYHRLFNHNYFTCNKFWHRLFGLIGSFSLNLSPVQWTAIHTVHHKFADTPLDSYESSWKYFFRIADIPNIKPTKNELRMMRDPFHRFLINYSFLLSTSIAAILLFFGLEPFLFLYALPVTAYLVVSGLHTIFSHTKNGSIDRWYMEFILPMSGEWLHKEHHSNTRSMKWNTKPYHFDLGAYIISIIKTHDKSITRTI